MFGENSLLILLETIWYHGKKKKKASAKWRHIYTKSENKLSQENKRPFFMDYDGNSDLKEPRRKSNEKKKS